MSTIVPPSFFDTETDKIKTIQNRPPTPFFRFSDEGSVVDENEEQRIGRVLVEFKKTLTATLQNRRSKIKAGSYKSSSYQERESALRALGIDSKTIRSESQVYNPNKHWGARVHEITDPMQLFYYEINARRNGQYEILKGALEERWETFALMEGAFNIYGKKQLNVSWKECFFSCKFKNLLEEAKGDYQNFSEEWKSFFDIHSYLVKFLNIPYCYSSWKYEDNTKLEQILTKFNSIQELDLEGWSDVSVELMTKIKSLNYLKILDLSSSDVSDDALLSMNWSTVAHLKLGNTEITNRGLKSIENCIEIELLDLSSCCHLDDKIGKTLSNLFLLRHLNLSGCHGISEEGFRFLDNMALMQELNVGYTSFSEESLIHLRYLSRLAKLDLSSTAITGKGMHWIPNMQLNELKMRRCRELDGNWYEALRKFDRLQKLDLSFNGGLPTEALSSLKGLPLENLDLSYCYRLGKGVDIYLSKMTSLKELYLSGCMNIPGSSFKSLGKLTSLELLFVDETCINHEAVERFSQMHSLHFLSMAYCENVDKKVMEALTVLRSLFHLSLAGCRGVDEKSLKALSSSNVSKLDLSACSQLSSQGVEALMFFSNLKHVSLFRCPRVKLGVQVLQEMPDLLFEIVM